MPEDEKKPIGDSVAKVGGAVAVGEDLAFQRRWWKFERGIWVVFALILVADLSGILGRGPLSKKEGHATDGSLLVKYESVERANTPSIMTVLPGAAAVQNGVLRLFVSNAIVDQLGTQRVIPSPALSTVGNGGVTYTFSATTLPLTVQFALQPSFIGSHAFRMGVPGQDVVQGKIYVLP